VLPATNRSHSVGCKLADEVVYGSVRVCVGAAPGEKGMNDTDFPAHTISLDCCTESSIDFIGTPTSTISQWAIGTQTLVVSFVRTALHEARERIGPIQVK